MSFGDDTPADGSYDPFDQLRHDLKSPLAVIHGRSQLLTRSVRRSPSLTEEERGRMLDGLAVIEAVVLAMVSVIDGLGHAPRDGSADAMAPGTPGQHEPE